jgi:hypothetical protein
VLSVTINGKALQFKMHPNSHDQHLDVGFALNTAANTVVIRTRNDFGLALSNELPPLGSASAGLRIVNESWNPARTELTLNVSGLSGGHYELSIWNSSQISSVDGATVTKFGKLLIDLPKGAADSYVPQKIVIHFPRS